MSARKGPAPTLPLSSARAEAFAQALARGEPAKAAATAAGFRALRYASRLLRRPAVIARIAAISAVRAGGGSRDISALIDELIEIARSARGRQDDPRALSVARACLVDAARLKQQLPAEATALDDAEAAYFAELDRPMSDEEWTRRYGPEAPGGRVGDGQ